MSSLVKTDPALREKSWVKGRNHSYLPNNLHLIKCHFSLWQNLTVTNLLNQENLGLNVDFLLTHLMNLNKELRSPRLILFIYNKDNNIYFVGYYWRLEINDCKKPNEVPISH